MATQSDCNPELVDYITRNILPLYNHFDPEKGPAYIDRAIEFCLKSQVPTPLDCDYAITAYHGLGYAKSPDNDIEYAAAKLAFDKHLKQWFRTEELLLMKDAILDCKNPLGTKPRSFFAETLIAFFHGYNRVCYYTDGYATVQKEGQWGLVDSRGKLIVPPKYEEFLGDYDRIRFTPTRLFCHDVAAVCKKGKWGFINEKGEEVIPCIYTKAEIFLDSTATVWQTQKQPDGTSVFEQFLIDTTGKKVSRTYQVDHLDFSLPIPHLPGPEKE